MAIITTDIPDHLNEWIEARVKSGFYTSSGDYLRTLIRSDAAQRQEFELMMLEGLHSNKRLGDEKFWEERSATLQKHLDS